jgi:hypothetical protein
MGRNSKENRPWHIRKEPSRQLPGGENGNPRKPIFRTGDGRILTYLLPNAQDTFCRISLPQGNGKPFCLWHASSPDEKLGSNKRPESKVRRNWKHSFYNMQITYRGNSCSVENLYEISQLKAYKALINTVWHRKTELLRCVVAAMYSWQNYGRGTVSCKQSRHSVIIEEWNGRQRAFAM